MKSENAQTKRGEIKMSETILSHEEQLEIFNNIESGRYSKTAAKVNLFKTFSEITLYPVHFEKLNANEIQVLDGVLRALVNRIKKLEQVKE